MLCEFFVSKRPDEQLKTVATHLLCKVWRLNKKHSTVWARTKMELCMISTWVCDQLTLNLLANSTGFSADSTYCLSTANWTMYLRIIFLCEVKHLNCLHSIWPIGDCELLEFNNTTYSCFSLFAEKPANARTLIHLLFPSVIRLRVQNWSDS